jgi:hypothetical protein
VVTVTVPVISNALLMGKLKRKTPWQNFRKNISVVLMDPVVFSGWFNQI